MTNKRDLKAFVRYDGSGRVVAGSLILRRKKPKVGKLTEIQGYQCCNQDQARILVDIDGSFPFTYSSFEIGNNDGDWYQPIYSYSDISAANIDELAALYNANFSNLGTFSVIDGNLYLTPSTGIAAFYNAALGSVTELYARAFED